MLAAAFIYLVKQGKISLTGNLKHYLHAKKSIKLASKADELPEILKIYLEAKMKTQMGLMNMDEVCNKLHLDTRVSVQLKSMWNHLNMLKYAPSVNSNSKDVLGSEKAKLLALLSSLEKEIK